jgi:hypothetical protein
MSTLLLGISEQNYPQMVCHFARPLHCAGGGSITYSFGYAFTSDSHGIPARGGPVGPGISRVGRKTRRAHRVVAP